MKPRNIYLSLVMVAFLLMVGCGTETNSTSKTQVAAKVNNEEITVHQLNQVLMSMGNRANHLDQDKVMTSVLDNLINQSILVQEAKKAKLDRDPVVMQAIEAAKRKVLTDAYLQRSATQPPVVSDNQISAYYSSNPELFADRKLFRYQQLTLSSEGNDQALLVEKVKQIETMSEYTDWLSEQGVDYKVILNAKTSESIPATLLKPLSVLKKGDVGFLKMADGLLVIELIDIVEQPVSLEFASQAIENHLTTQLQKEQLKQKIAALRSQAIIKYMGDFKQNLETAVTESVPQADVASDMKVKSHLEKGLEGLK
ncbi:EpsD family peptidyl-prolyl cis-trans isomerase [Cycloclasticus pugetii]|uniref:EpsD family peptidyl-prolyl cis-trans isomerase n=1 Tax=Cycloclasticus pugetii TaxID=34068 RepID=UPI00037B01A1|nr:EpsD family peptidyl-prolyl cis-trans isomerase [Cycloclasticus pugetii]